MCMLADWGTPRCATCRVVISNWYFSKLLMIVLRLEQQPWWAWAGERHGFVHPHVSCG